MSKKDLIERIGSEDPEVRGEAWQGAGNAGPAVIPGLAKLAASGDFEIVRAAKRALWKIVRHVGRPGAEDERTPVVEALTKLLGARRPPTVRREVLWMLSELAVGGRAVRRVAGLLSDPELCEDARMALERIPGEESLAALQKGLESAPAELKTNIAQSLRARGVDVPGLPCRKLVPSRPTAVKAPGA